MRQYILFALVAAGIPVSYGSVLAFPTPVESPLLQQHLRTLGIGTVEVSTRHELIDGHLAPIATATVTMVGAPLHGDASSEAAAVANIVLDDWTGAETPAKVEVEVKILQSSQGVPTGGVGQSLRHADTSVGWRRRR